MKRFGIMAGLWLLGAASLQAAPVITPITDVADNGATVEISGSSFGGHGDFNGSTSGLYFRWKDFEDCAIESDGFSIHNFPNWENEGRWSVETTGARPQPGASCYGSKRYATSGSSPRLGTLSADQSGTTGEWFISFWFMMPPGTQAGKPFRIYGSGSAQNIYIGSGEGPGWENRMIRAYSECSNCSPSPKTVWNSPDAFENNTWHRVDIVLDQSPDEMTVWLDQQQQWSVSSQSDGNYAYQYVANPFGGNGHSIDLGNMIDDPSQSGGLDGSYNYDDAYISFTRARVELCSGATWSGRGTCEIQPVLSWSNGSITFRANHGAFPSSSAAYVYVVDSSGVANPTGSPIALGEGGPAGSDGPAGGDPDDDGLPKDDDAPPPPVTDLERTDTEEDETPP